MRARHKSGKCVHCLKYTDNLTMDHVFPASWYPSNTSDKTQRAKVPSCSGCNSRLGAIEQDIGIRMWACIDPDKPQAQGLRQKVMESLGVGVSGLSKKERAIRENIRKKLVASMEPFTSGTRFKVYEGFGPHEGFSLREQQVIRIPFDKLYVVAEKVIRGLEYRQKGLKRYIEDPYKLEVFPNVKEKGLSDFINIVNQLPVNQHSPGFEIRRAETSDKEEILYRIKFWDTWVVYGFVSKKAISRKLT